MNESVNDIDVNDDFIDDVNDDDDEDDDYYIIKQ